MRMEKDYIVAHARSVLIDTSPRDDLIGAAEGYETRDATVKTLLSRKVGTLKSTFTRVHQGAPRELR